MDNERYIFAFFFNPEADERYLFTFFNPEAEASLVVCAFKS